MSENSLFTIDSSSHAIEGDLLPPVPDDVNKETSEKKPISRAAAVKSLGSAIGGAHWVAAKVLDEPDLELNKDEKKVYGEVTVDLLKAHGYDLSTNPKMAAWINFIVVAMEIDGPRAVLVITKPPEKRYTEAEEGEVPPLVFPEKQASHGYTHLTEEEWSSLPKGQHGSGPITRSKSAPK